MSETSASGLRPSALKMYLTVIGVGVACSIAIVSVHEFTRPWIEQNRLEYRRSAIRAVLPASESTIMFTWGERGEFVKGLASSTAKEVIFAGYSTDGRLVGFAIEAEGKGYQDTIRVLYGYSPAAQEIIGIRVLESRETPGLGDRIETNAAFLRNFDHLDVSVTTVGDAIEHPIEFVDAGSKDAAWQIDGISGATISSRAIATMLEASTTKWIPRIRGQLSAMERIVWEGP